MNNLCTVLVEGNLTRDPELSYTPKGVACCKFSIAVNRRYKQGDEYVKEVSYFDIVAWTRLAEVCGEYLKKGRGVRVVGRLKQDRWEKDGQPHSRINIVAEHCEFKDAKKEGGQTGEEVKQPIPTATDESSHDNIPF